MDFLTSNSMRLMEKSMGFLWTKQAAILDNVANAETPNYKAKVVTFEDSIRAKLEEAAQRPEGAGRAVREVLEDFDVEIEERHHRRKLADGTVQEHGQHGASGCSVRFAVVTVANPVGVAGRTGRKSPAVVCGVREFLTDAFHKRARGVNGGSVRQRHDETAAPDCLLAAVYSVSRQIGHSVHPGFSCALPECPQVIS